MLYQIYETQRSFMEPFADFAQATSKLYSNPALPIQKTTFAQRMSASYDLIYRLGKDYVKPEFGIKTIPVDGVEVAIHERIELSKPFCDLRRFKRFSDDTATLATLKTQPVVLIVAPLSGHYATLLRDTVRTMLQGHKVYITDWKNARLVPLSDGAFHLDDYVHYVEDFIRHLQDKYGNCHVMSVCQPTVPVLAAVSLMATRGEQLPLSMTMMGGPIDARKSPTSVNDLAVKRSFEWFENNVIYRVPNSFPGKGRRVYPGFLQHTGFIAMNPDRHAGNHYDYFKNLVKGDGASTEAHRSFYDEYNAVLDMDADYYLETIDTVFQQYKLVNGTWDVRASDGTLERVRPQDIKTSTLLTVEGELDDISGSGQTRAAHTLCSGIPTSNERHLEVKGAGHYGIFSGRRWRDVVYPQVRDFIAEHQAAAVGAKKSVAAATPTAPAATAPSAALRTVAPKQTAAATPAATTARKPVATPTASKALAPAPVAAPKPVVASKPAKAIQAAKVVEAPKPANAATKAVEALKPAKAAKPVEAVKPAKAGAATKPVQPAKPVEAVKAVQPAEAAKLAKTNVAAKPAEPVRPVETVKTAEAAASQAATPVTTRWVGSVPSEQPTGAAAPAVQVPAQAKTLAVTSAPPAAHPLPASRKKT